MEDQKLLEKVYIIKKTAVLCVVTHLENCHIINGPRAIKIETKDIDALSEAQGRGVELLGDL